jgi:hypothetical protein
MNNNTSRQQFPSEDSPREELDKLQLRVEHHVRDVMRKDGWLRPTLFAVSPKGLSIFAPGPLNEVSEKNEFAAVARLICAAQGAIAVVLAIEAWVLEAKPGERLDPHALPSASPHRREFIHLSGEALGRTYQQKFLPMLRDHRGRFACLGMAKVLPPEAAEGRFANLLPQIPVTEEVRAFAAAVLKTKGIFRVKSLGEY